MNEQGPEGGRGGRVLGIAFAVVVCLLGVFVFAIGSPIYLPPVASVHGEGIDAMLIYLLVTTGTLVVIGHLVLGYFVFKFSRAAAASPTLPSARAEKIWSVVPAILMTLVAEGGVLVIGIPVFNQLYNIRSTEEETLVEVTGEQFTWNVRYPGPDRVFGRTDPHLISAENALGMDPDDPAGADDILDLALIVVPVNRPVRVRLRSKDVLHSFFLPNLRIKQDAVPGMTIDVWFTPTREGEFELACTELCGFGHYQMRGFLRVLSESDYASWLAEKQG